MGQVIHCNGAARDPKVHNLFQVADVDSEVIRLVNANADLATHIQCRPALALHLFVLMHILRIIAFRKWKNSSQHWEKSIISILILESPWFRCSALEWLSGAWIPFRTWFFSWTGCSLLSRQLSLWSLWKLVTGLSRLNNKDSAAQALLVNKCLIGWHLQKLWLGVS